MQSVVCSPELLLIYWWLAFGQGCSLSLEYPVILATNPKKKLPKKFNGRYKFIEGLVRLIHTPFCNVAAEFCGQVLCCLPRCEDWRDEVFDRELRPPSSDPLPLSHDIYGKNSSNFATFINLFNNLKKKNNYLSIIIIYKMLLWSHCWWSGPIHIIS